MYYMQHICTLGVMLAAGLVLAESHSSFTDSGARDRVLEVIKANIVATHAYQVNLALKSGKGDTNAWSTHGLSASDLDALVKHQQALLSTPAGEIAAWVRGQKSTFEPARDLNPILASPLSPSAANLPVNAITRILGEYAGISDFRISALASLMQMMLDTERDATQLQDMFTLYVALGLPVHTVQLGLKETTDADFLTLAQRISPALCASPFDTDSVTIRMQFRKMWNWGHRYTGERDKTVLAHELMEEPEVQAILPRVRAMPAQKIAVIGHSYTMGVHWASPSAFVPIVAEIFALVNPKVEVRQWQAGGMNPSRADCQTFYKEALAWKPDRVLIVLADRDPKDTPALEKMAAGFAAQDTKAMMPDSIYGSLPMSKKFYWDSETLRAISSKTGIALIPVGAAIDASPDKGHFLALDSIHMTEPYHRLMAKAWLKYLAGTETAKMTP